jgi:hypothetical protein
MTSTYRARRPAPREKRPCNLCDRQYDLEQLSRCGYESEDGRHAGDGLVCPGCANDLPSQVLVNGRTWPLVFRAV